MYLFWNLISILLAYVANFLVVLPGLILVIMIHGFYPIPYLDQVWALAMKGLMALPVPQNMLTALFAFYVVIATGAGLLGFVGGYFPPTRFLLRAAVGSKIPSPEQMNQIRAAMDYISRKSGMDCTGKFNYYVQDISVINAFASGVNDITVTTPALETLSTPMLAGVLAHEMGHHAHRDTRTLLMINGIAYLGMLSILLVRIVNALFFVLRYIPFLNFVAAIFISVLNICLMIAGIIQRIPYAFFNVFCSRRIENAADAYTVKLGMGEEFIDSMQWMLDKGGDVSWFMSFFSDHPRVKSRIAHVKKLMEKRNRNEVTAAASPAGTVSSQG